MTHLLIIGAASIDTKGRASRPLQAGTSTQGHPRQRRRGRPEHCREPRPPGERVVLLSAVGSDGSGQRILQQASECGIDISHVWWTQPSHRRLPGRPGRKANLMMSIDDMVITRKWSHLGSSTTAGPFRDARMIILDANLSAAPEDHLFPHPQVCHTGVCRSDHRHVAPRLCPYLPELLLVTPNAAEAEACAACRSQTAKEPGCRSETGQPWRPDCHRDPGRHRTRLRHFPGERPRASHRV